MVFAMTTNQELFDAERLAWSFVVKLESDVAVRLIVAREAMRELGHDDTGTRDAWRSWSTAADKLSEALDAAYGYTDAVRAAGLVF